MFTLKDFLSVLGVGTDLCVVDVESDQEIIRTSNFKIPYQVLNDVPAKEYYVVAVGTYGRFKGCAVGCMLVFVRRNVK